MGLETSNQNYGWRILSKHPSGPCKDIEIIPFFDYIIGCDGNRLDGASVTLKEYLEAYKDKPLDLTILNYKSNLTRTVTVVPREFDGPGLLGLIITNDNFSTADERVVRVISVFDDSPGGKGGLVEKTDYILGTTTRVWEHLDDFYNLIMGRIDTDIELMVYSSVTAQVRHVVIHPTNNWSGSKKGGFLGCEVGCGILHKIPSLEEDHPIGWKSPDPSYEQFSPTEPEIPPPPKSPPVQQQPPPVQNYQSQDARSTNVVKQAGPYPDLLGNEEPAGDSLQNARDRVEQLTAPIDSPGPAPHQTLPPKPTPADMQHLAQGVQDLGLNQVSPPNAV